VVIPDIVDESAQDRERAVEMAAVAVERVRSHTKRVAWRYGVPEKWQYKTVSITAAQHDQLDEILNSYGEAGWELVSVIVDGWRPLGFLGGAQQPTYRAIFKARA